MFFSLFVVVVVAMFVFLFCSCVADNALGRTKKYIEISGRPGPAEFISPTFSGSLEVYNLTWSIESIPPLEEVRLLYRRLMVSIRQVSCLERLFFIVAGWMPSTRPIFHFGKIHYIPICAIIIIIMKIF